MIESFRTYVQKYKLVKIYFEWLTFYKFLSLTFVYLQQFPLLLKSTQFMYVVDVSLSQYAIVIRSNDIFLSVLFPLWNEFFHTFIGRNKQLAWWYFCQNMEAASKKTDGQKSKFCFCSQNWQEQKIPPSVQAEALTKGRLVGAVHIVCAQ